MSLVVNKKIHLEYSVEEKRVFGVQLLGTEVKSLRLKQGSLEGGKIAEVGGELFLLGAYIPAYQEKNALNFDPYRTRKLLANKKEILEIHNLKHGQNLQMYPIAFFDKGGLIKLECGLGHRLKKADKRQVIRDKDDKRKDL
jgi:SsrA-binding protein